MSEIAELVRITASFRVSSKKSSGTEALAKAAGKKKTE